MGLIQSGGLSWKYLASGCIRADSLSGQLTGFHFASGVLVGTSGILVSVNSLGQIVFGFDDKWWKSGK